MIRQGRGKQSHWAEGVPRVRYRVGQGGLALVRTRPYNRPWGVFSGLSTPRPRPGRVAPDSLDGPVSPYLF